MAGGSERASLVGELVYGYRVEAAIGRGSHGDIYRLRHPTLANRLLALKVLRDGRAAGEEERARFLQDALAASEVGGEGVVQPIHVDELPDGTPYIVMELAPGRSLDRELRDGPLPIAVVLAIAEKVARTMARVHARGIVHRDLKPANIMVERDGAELRAVKLLDFGVALVPDDLKRVKTAENQFFGTPCYIAPEIGTGRAVDGRADVFSLGVVLFEALTGQTPFDGLMETIGEVPAPSVAARRPAERGPVPPEVERLVAAALAKRVEERPTMERLRADLEAALAAAPPEAALRSTVKAMGAVPQPRAPGQRREEFSTTNQLFELFGGDPRLIAAPVDPAQRDTAPHDRAELEAAIAAAAPKPSDSMITGPTQLAPAPAPVLIPAPPTEKQPPVPAPSAPTEKLERAKEADPRATVKLPAEPQRRAPVDAPTAVTVRPAPARRPILPAETWRVAPPAARPAARSRIAVVGLGFVIGVALLGAGIALYLRFAPPPAPTVREVHLTPPPAPEPPAPPPAPEPPAPPPAAATRAWAVVDTGTREALFDVWGDGRGGVFAVGGAGTLLRSRDHGRSFARAAGDFDPGEPPPLFGVWGSDGEVWAVGDRGVILHSGDGGDTWTRQPAPTVATLGGVAGAGRDDLFIVGNPSVILHSDDGGAHWRRQQPHNGNGLRRVYVPRRGEAWAVGWGETILHTVDGGARWSAAHGDGAGTLFDVWGDGALLIAVGAQHPPGSGPHHRDDLILRSDDGGDRFRAVPSASRAPLYAVGGLGADLYVGGPNAALLRGDGGGGDGWTREPLPARAGKLSRIWGSPGDGIFIAGSDGVLLHRAP